MRITVAKNAGFCYGVSRAVDMAERFASLEHPCYTLGTIIHNPQMVQQLKDKGVISVDSVNDIPRGATIIIRSHGVTKDIADRLASEGYDVRDATCPCVKSIHEMAIEAAQAGIPVIVVGAKDHPEVQGILGWTMGLGQAVETIEQAEALPKLERALIVSQTTLSEAAYNSICDVLSRRVLCPKIKNTLCPATKNRYEEAQRIAYQVDMMLVVGGRNSSNTQKLYELCSAICKETYLIETAREISEISRGARDRIGITAGASTPDCTFKEVVARMNDNENMDQITQANDQTEDKQVEETNQAVAAPAEEPQESKESTSDSDFMADIERTMVQIRPGQTITGTVVQITEDEVCVNVGYKADGLVKMSDMTSTDVKVGDEIEVEVVKVNDGEGNVLLSQRNIVNRKFWDEIVAKHEADEYVDGVGKEAVKGGLIATVNGIRTFIPASQLSQRYVEKIEDFVGQDMKLKIIEIDKPKKRIVASRKAVLIAEEAGKKKDIWDKLDVGSVVKGIVRRLTDFGAFVDIGGVDGLVHVTDLSWGRVRHPSDVVSVNQEIDVKILNLDPEKERISLSYKQTQARPWDVASEKYPVSGVAIGKVVRITTFGAFVELEPGLDGLVHISQCALTRINKVEDAVQVGQEVRVKILDVNTDARRISLSIRAVLEDEAFENMPDQIDEYAIVSEELSFAPMAEAPVVEEPVVEETVTEAAAPEEAAPEEAAPEEAAPEEAAPEAPSEEA